MRKSRIQDDATLGLEVQVVGWEMDALPFQIGWGRFNIRSMTLEYFRIPNRCKQQFPSQNLVVFKVGSYLFEWGLAGWWSWATRHSAWASGDAKMSMSWIGNRSNSEGERRKLWFHTWNCIWNRVPLKEWTKRKRIFLATVYDSKDHKIFLIAKLSNHKSMNIHWISWLHASSRLHLAQASLWQQITWWIRC